MEQKKYQDITRLGHKTTIGVLTEGDWIVIQEKLDGANASFRKGKDGEILTFSRNTPLTGEDGLGGFRRWALETLDPDLLLPNIVYFGEWLNPHKVKYPEYQKQFFLYDLYDTNTGLYLDFNRVKDAHRMLGLNLIPVLYEGEYKDFDHLMSFVGQTKLGGRLGDIETGEGIVVKNVGFVDRHGNQKFVKLVTDKFREVQSQKAPKDPKMEATQEQLFVNATMTEARVEKMLYKLADEGIIDEAPFQIEDMGVILRNMGTRIFDDIMKEESDMLPADYDENQVRKAVGRNIAQIVKKIIAKQ
ncbi:RNA ligase [Bacillus phage vB_BanS_Skywalker]|uniref:RNA ligase n=1 Tax=Bacillus phage vB_BanS_Skywalker TaxID=2894789 RepID=A0AAE9CET8_9CAUD|nr:RNA ligase [Bacillus phage vB_BanS_Skywalker]UGO51272.1 RNA ligase [Bacillus phage vB_BanS_Skywalker]